MLRHPIKVTTLRYLAGDGYPAACGVGLLELAPGVAGLALCEPRAYYGPSITNNVEVAATLALRRFGLDPARTVCFEHHPTGNAGRKRPTWAFVRFEVSRDLDGAIALTRPDWQPLALPEQWRALALAAGCPNARWLLDGFGDVEYPDELSGRIDVVWPIDVLPG